MEFKIGELITADVNVDYQPGCACMVCVCACDACSAYILGFGVLKVLSHVCSCCVHAVKRVHSVLSATTGTVPHVVMHVPQSCIMTAAAAWTQREQCCILMATVARNTMQTSVCVCVCVCVCVVCAMNMYMCV
jgi:hypothetical protein